MNNSYLIDSFKEKFGLTSDTEVAFILNISSQMIYNWRSGFRPIPIDIKLRLLDHLGYANVRDLIHFFVSKEVHDKLLQFERTRMLDHAEVKMIKEAQKKTKKVLRRKVSDSTSDGEHKKK